MKSPLKIGLNLLALGLIGMGMYNANKVNSAGTQEEGYSVTSLEAIYVHGECAVLTEGQGRFISTRSLGEWTAFKNAAPALGVGVTTCEVYNATYYYGDVADGCGGAGDCSGA